MSNDSIEKDVVTCVAIGVYSDALTRGKQYRILGCSEEGNKISLKGDNGRQRWFPAFLFGNGVLNLPSISEVIIEDDFSDQYSLPVEVVVRLSNGERRWCIFATPQALANCGDMLEGTNIRYHYGPHLLIATELSDKIIAKILHELDNQDNLPACTLPTG